MKFCISGNGAMGNAHAKALKAHVDALSSKKYWDIPGNSPELVIRMAYGTSKS